MGTSQAKLTVLPDRTVYLTGKPMANISDHKSMVNLGAFGRCRSMGFPATASATAAAQGTLTPMPCMHNTPFPWMGGKNDYIVKGNPALLKSSRCQCMWGGTISLVTDGQVGEGTQWVTKMNKQQFTLNQRAADQIENPTGSMNGITASSNAVDMASTKKALESFLKNNPQWFKNKRIRDNNTLEEGFQSLQKEPNPKNNGSTNAYGTIWLTEEIMNNCLTAFKKMEKGESIKSEEAKSLSTLWHEITHNMHEKNKDFIEEEDIITKQKKKRSIPLSDAERKYMEIANEFVARKTLPEFYKTIAKDGDIKYRKVYEPYMSDRSNTNYNKRVRDYDAAIAKYELEKEVVLEVVKKGLFETDYHKQRTNLINGLLMGGQYYDTKTHTYLNKISPQDAIRIVNGLLRIE